MEAKQNIYNFKTSKRLIFCHTFKFKIIYKKTKEFKNMFFPLKYFYMSDFFVKNIYNFKIIIMFIVNEI